MISVSGGYNNWWTWNFDVKAAPEQSEFSVSLHPEKPVRKMTFQDAADYTAQCIADQYKNLYLALGGGTDSEFVADVLLRNHIPFKPVVGYVKGSRNLDFHYALNWCDRTGVEPTIIEFVQDDQRLVKQAFNFATTYRLEKPRMLIVMAVLEYIHEQQGHALTGDPSIGYTDVDENFYKGIGDKFEIWWVELISSTFRPGHPGAFFFHTPELVFAQARELDITLNDTRSRAKLYQVPFRPKTWPPEVLTCETQDKISKLLEIDKYSIPKNYCWSKEELLKIFNDSE